LVPNTQGLNPESQTRYITGEPLKRTPMLESREKAAFKLKPLSRVEALKNSTGRASGFIKE